MADEQQAQQEQAAQTAADNPNQLDPAFFDCVNEYLEVTNRQSQQQGLKRISLASTYAAARFNAHVFLSNVHPSEAANDRPAFLDYMTGMFRRMLNEHLDGLGMERNIDVGVSELANEYAAMGVQVGRMGQAPSVDAAAAGATPPATPQE